MTRTPTRLNENLEPELVGKMFVNNTPDSDTQRRRTLAQVYGLLIRLGEVLGETSEKSQTSADSHTTHKPGEKKSS